MNSCLTKVEYKKLPNYTAGKTSKGNKGNFDKSNFKAKWRTWQSNFLCRAYGKELRELGTVGWCDNTAISIIDFDESLKPQVVIANDASHLDEGLSTISKQDWWIKLQGGMKQ